MMQLAKYPVITLALPQLSNLFSNHSSLLPLSISVCVSVSIGYIKAAPSAQAPHEVN